jgi:hypothetical protein
LPGEGAPLTRGVSRRTHAGMTADELRARAKGGDPPADLAPLLRALWLDARGDWAGAHEIAQDDESPAAAWVHAYLHRKEGDRANAAYWYRHAKRPEGSGSLEDEWRAIASALVVGSGAVVR